jgi:hypothetical protein
MNRRVHFMMDRGATDLQQNGEDQIANGAEYDRRLLTSRKINQHKRNIQLTPFSA